MKTKININAIPARENGEPSIGHRDDLFSPRGGFAPAEAVPSWHSGGDIAGSRTWIAAEKSDKSAAANHASLFPDGSRGIDTSLQATRSSYKSVTRPPVPSLHQRGEGISDIAF
jgi:hypothetical protein